MIVVSDTTPLNYFVLIGEADILPTLFGRVVIPPAVAAELLHAHTPELVRSWMSSPPSWLEVHAPTLHKADELNYLGAGERQAILLAEELRAEWLIIDEYKGRVEANRRKLPVIGTVRVLDEAADRQLIKLPDVLTKLQRTSFFLSPDLVRWLLNRDAVRPKRF
jgi:predicted nucleic acid-binding protein